MRIRILSFLGGALFGGIGAAIDFRLIEHSLVTWWIVGLAALVMGLLAAAAGRKFWDTALGLWI